MARRAKKATAAAESVDPTTLGDAAEPRTPVPEAALDFPPAESSGEPPAGEPQGEAKPFVSKLPDPHGRHLIDIGDGRKMRLYLNRRFFQNAIQFTAPEDQNPKPDPADTGWLKEHGWTWRNEERVWTKQLDRNSEGDRFARARSDKLAEDEFVTLANTIRQRKGLEPVEYVFTQDRAAQR